MEFFKRSSQKLRLEAEYVLIYFLLTLSAAILTLAMITRLPPPLGIIRVSLSCSSLIRRHSAFRDFTFLFFIHALALFLKTRLMLTLIFIELVYKKLNIRHVLDAKTLTDRVNLDLKLLFGGSVHTALQRIIVDQELCLINQEAEHLLHALVLLTSCVLVLGANTLVVDQLALRMSVSVCGVL